MISCNMCKSRFLSHSRLVACNISDNRYHLNCISLIPTEQQEILKEALSWMCGECHQHLFPFNWMDVEEFMGVINANKYHFNNLYCDDGNVLQIFDHVEENAALPTYDLDPDLNFYNDYVPDLNLNCKNFAEESFNFTYDHMHCKNGTCPASLCHINIRSAPKNLKHCEYFLAGLQHEFTFIGLTESLAHKLQWGSL